MQLAKLPVGKMSIRFPVGKKNVGKCLYAWWKVDGASLKLGYNDGRKHVYLPLYAKAVVKAEAYRRQKPTLSRKWQRFSKSSNFAITATF